MLSRGIGRARTLSAGRGGRLGHIELSTRETAGVDAESAAPSPALFHGVLHNERDLGRAAGAPRRPGEAVDALIQWLYEAEGERCVSQLEGEFALAIADTRRGRVLVATPIPVRRPTPAG